MQAANRVAKNTGILYLRMAITVFISLYSTRLILGALGIEDFGLYNVVGGAISMLLFLNNAMTGATQRFMSFSQGEGNFEKQKHIFNVSIVLNFITAILIVLLLEIAGYFLFENILKISEDRIEAARLIFHFLVVSTFITVISVPYDAVINAHENMLVFAILGILEAILKLGIAIYITRTSFDKLVIFGLLMAILQILLLLIRQIYCRRRYPESQINIKKYYSKPLFKEMASFASWSLVGCTSSMISSYGQGIVINIFFGTIVNAAQGIANQVNGQLGAFAGTMRKALNPMIAKSEGAGNREMTLKASMIGSKTSFFLLMFTFIPVLIEMPYIFGIWLKEVPEFAVIFCRLLLIRNLVEQMYATLTSTIEAVGNIKRFQIIVSILYFLPIVVSYIFYSFHFPAYTLYIVFLVFSLLTSVVVVYFAKINCQMSVSDFMKNVVFRSACSFAIVFILALVPVYFVESGFFRLIIVSFVALCSFFIVVWFIGFSIEERLYIKGMLNKLFCKLNIGFRVKQILGKA